MKSILQKAAVRVISSELDRRAAPIEQALLDAHARIDASQASVEASAAAVRSTQSALDAVNATHERISARLEELFDRIRGGEDVDRAHLAAIEQLRFDVSAAQAGLAEVTGVIERLTQAG